MPLDYIKSAAEVQADAADAHKRRVTQAIDRHVEDQAKAMEYNSAARLAGYANSTVPEWKADADAFIAWNDACWVAAIAMLADAEASGEAPRVEDVLAALPDWPDA